MLMILILLGVNKCVAIETTKLIFIIPEKIKIGELNKVGNGAEGINQKKQDDQGEENVHIIRIYYVGGFIELKIEDFNKEEICSIIEQMIEKDLKKLSEK